MSFFVAYRKELARTVGLPETASWEECLAKVKKIINPCDGYKHDWQYYFHYRGCYICGLTEEYTK